VENYAPLRTQTATSGAGILAANTTVELALAEIALGTMSNFGSANYDGAIASAGRCTGRLFRQELKVRAMTSRRSAGSKLVSTR